MNGHLARQVEAVDLGLLFEDRDAGLHVRRLQVRDQPPFEAVPESFLETRNVLRNGVRGEDDLSACLVEGVERVEELFLRTLAVREELDVVDDENVDLPERRLELVHSIAAQRRDELSHEDFCTQVRDAGVRIRLDGGMSDGIGEVRFAESHPAVEKERIVVVARLSGDGFARRVRELVAGADDERRERVARDEAAEARRPAAFDRRITGKQLALRTTGDDDAHATRPAGGSHRVLEPAGMVQRHPVGGRGRRCDQPQLVAFHSHEAQRLYTGLEGVASEARQQGLTRSLPRNLGRVVDWCRAAGIRRQCRVSRAGTLGGEEADL